MTAAADHASSLGFRILSSEVLGDFRVFRAVRQRVAPLSAPADAPGRDYYVMHCPDWVCILALTPEDRVILVRQYRHGVARITLELPAGVVEPGESPEATARRELAEETGYTASDWRCLGALDPNPALENNRCFAFLALDARLTAPPAPDHDEVLAISTLPLCEVPGLLRRGEITHSLVHATFGLLALEAGGFRRPGPGGSSAR